MTIFTGAVSKILHDAIKSVELKVFLADLNNNHFNLKQEDQIRDQLVAMLNKQKCDLFALSEYPKLRSNRQTKTGTWARAEVDLSFVKRFPGGAPDLSGATQAQVELKFQYPGDFRNQVVRRAILNDMSRICFPGLTDAEVTEIFNPTDPQKTVVQNVRQHGRPTTHLILIVQERTLFLEGYPRIGALSYIPANSNAEEFCDACLDQLHNEMSGQGIVLKQSVVKHVVKVKGTVLQSRYHFFIYEIKSCRPAIISIIV